MSRLSRKEIKRDEVLERVGSVVEFARTHMRSLLLAVAAVIVGVLIVVAMFAYRSGRNEEANDLFARALEVYEAPIVADGPQPDDPESPSFASAEDRARRASELFEELREKFGGTRVGAVAAVYLGEFASKAGDYDRARELWDGFLGRFSDEALATQTRVNLMTLDRVQGRGAELADRLAASLDNEDNSLPEDLLLHELAVTLEGLSRAAEAGEIYQRLANDHPQSPFAAEARRQAGALASGG